MTSSASFDAARFKAATRTQWDECANGWNASSGLIRSWLRGPTDAMLAMADVRAGLRVLDVAAGAGDQTLDIAGQAGPTGSVVATDLSPAILEAAKVNAANAGYRNVETLVSDGENLAVEDASFDAAICRLGLMLFPDPAKGVAEMYRALRPGGKACTMVFSSPEHNPCVGILVSTAMKHAGLPPRDPFQPGGLLSLGKPGLVDELFRDAGFSDVSTTRVSAPMALPSVQYYLDFIRTSASPILNIIAGLADDKKCALWNEVEQRLREFDLAAGGWKGPNELLLTAGRR